MIGYTVPEIRRLMIDLIRPAPRPRTRLVLVTWRRRRQHQARLCHYQRRGYALT